jgi:hypothetical protein
MMTRASPCSPAASRSAKARSSLSTLAGCGTLFARGWAQSRIAATEATTVRTTSRVERGAYIAADAVRVVATVWVMVRTAQQNPVRLPRRMINCG